MTRSSWKLALLGGDGEKAQAYAHEAKARGHQIAHFASMNELGFLGRIREFDAVIVQDLNPLTGLEIAEYLEKLFQSLPAVLLSDDDSPAHLIDRLPLYADAKHVLERVLNAKRPKIRALACMP